MPMTTSDRVFGLRLLGVHQFIYERSGGRLGHRFGRTSMLLLRTVGRKSGVPRTVSLLYHRDGDRGSKGGSDVPPAWVRNVEAASDVEVQVGTNRFRANARVATDAERSTLWPEITRLYPQFARYQSQTRRVIPLVILEPQMETAA
jgi:deazaflavin-dependent oxidoreductase (nitroreductase family)